MENRYRDPRLPRQAVAVAVARAYEASAADRETKTNLRRSLRWLLHELQLWCERRFYSPDVRTRLALPSSAQLAEELLELLLQLEAVDLHGVTALVQSGQTATVRRRLQKARGRLV